MLCSLTSSTQPAITGIIYPRFRATQTHIATCERCITYIWCVLQKRIANYTQHGSVDAYVQWELCMHTHTPLLGRRMNTMYGAPISRITHPYMNGRERWLCDVAIRKIIVAWFFSIKSATQRWMESNRAIRKVSKALMGSTAFGRIIANGCAFLIIAFGSLWEPIF